MTIKVCYSSHRYPLLTIMCYKCHPGAPQNRKVILITSLVFLQISPHFLFDGGYSPTCCILQRWLFQIYGKLCESFLQLLLANALRNGLLACARGLIHLPCTDRSIAG